jgi:hypothetical protein
MQVELFNNNKNCYVPFFRIGGDLNQWTTTVLAFFCLALFVTISIFQSKMSNENRTTNIVHLCKYRIAI